MASIIIRNLPDNTKKILRVRAAEAGVSMEAYIRRILQEASSAGADTRLDILSLAGQYFGSKNGVELNLPTRKSKRGKNPFAV